MSNKLSTKLELSVYFNDRLLRMLPLDLSKVAEPVSTTVYESPAHRSKLICMELRLVGDAESAVRDGCDQVNMTVLMTPWQQAEAGQREPAMKISYGLDNHSRRISTRTTIYDRDGNRVDPPALDSNSMGNDPPEDPPHLVDS